MESDEARLFKSLSQLENTLRDTALDATINFAKQQNDLLKDDKRPIEERIEHAVQVANSLDIGDWKEFMYEQAIVTGKVFPVTMDPDYSSDSDYVWQPDISVDGEYALYSDSKEFFSQGFAVVHDDDEVSLQPLMMTPSEDDESEPELYVLDLDSYIKFSNIFSQEHAIALLESYAPNLLNGIDVNILNATNRGDALLSLRGLDMSEVESLEIGEDSVDLRSRVYGALCNYLPEATSLDRSLPYLMNYKGQAFVLNEKNAHPIDISCKDTAVSFHNFHILKTHSPSIGQASDTQELLGISATVHPSTKAEEDYEAVLFVDNLVDAGSVRDNLY